MIDCYFSTYVRQWSKKNILILTTKKTYVEYSPYDKINVNCIDVLLIDI